MRPGLYELLRWQYNKQFQSLSKQDQIIYVKWCVQNVFAVPVLTNISRKISELVISQVQPKQMWQIDEQIVWETG